MSDSSQLSVEMTDKLTIDKLNPRQIVTELDRYIVGQAEAKRAVAIAVRNRWRRSQLPKDMQAEIAPKNILMAGPTGVGKTEIARRLAKLTGAPFIKVEATKYTEVGYYGRDVESMIRDLVESAIGMVRSQEKTIVVEDAERRTEERLLDLLLPSSSSHVSSDDIDDDRARRERAREKMRTMLRDGLLDDRSVEFSVEQKSVPVMVGGIGLENMDVDLQSMLERFMPKSSSRRSMTVAEARNVILDIECDKLLDTDKINAKAIEISENLGIVFVDEIDKVIASEGRSADVSRQGVQRDLLPIVEGTTVQTKYGYVKTDHILFIAAGAFHNGKPSDLMPELQGRFPIRVELAELTKHDFVRILTEPRNSLTKQYEALLKIDGITVNFAEDAVERIAEYAFRTNQTTQNIGARRLYTILERLLEELNFNAPDMPEGKILIDANYVDQKLKEICQDEDLSKFIL